jgi:outer membrane protein assembly factor BamB
MGHWSHARHDANGNAVSTDTAVGPPERIRWVAANSGREDKGLVTTDGRNFYGHALTRDSFNGLRLWHNDLTQPADKADPSKFVMRPLVRGVARPVATEKFLFAVASPNDQLVAIDVTNGKIAFKFPEITKPEELVVHRGSVIATSDTGVYAYNAETGENLWSMVASDPRTVAANDDLVSFIQGRPKRGEKSEAVTVDFYSGKVLWRRSDFEFLNKVTRTVLYQDHLTYEVSSFNDHDANNSIHVVSAKSGEPSWEKHFPPGMNHRRQARAMYIGDDLWILHGGKTNTVDRDNMARLPIQVSALDPNTGQTRVTHDAGLAHCFPPVATPNFMFAGVLDMTDLNSGEVIVNPITKANCSTENGWIPANGLVYTTPKHCTCWPMLRGYVAMAPKHPQANPDAYPPNLPAEKISFTLEQGPAQADPQALPTQAGDWPLYRGDRWRSGGSGMPGPHQLDTLWSAQVSPAHNGLSASSPIQFDWTENPFVKGLVTAPVIAHGRVYVARPDAHEVVALNDLSGKIDWRFTARGRVDTPPAIYRALCLFGDHAGSVYALKADTGQLVWRLQAAPIDERIAAYGQIESPWPVSGAVLIIEDTAYFAAGRQPLADGGVLVFAISPLTGQQHWVKKIDTIPQKGFYENSGLEFDPIDILHQEGDGLAMSRWIISRDGKNVTVDKWNAFARINTGQGSVWTPRGFWNYGPRQIHRFANEAFRRPLCVYRDSMIIGCLNSTTALYRRDFDLENGETFNSKWITGWAAGGMARKGEKPYRSYRIAEKASWKVNPWAEANTPESLEKPTTLPGSSQLDNQVYGMALDADSRLYVIHQDGNLKVLDIKDGSTLSETEVPSPLWDGLALAQGKLYLSTTDGRLLCLGNKSATKVAAK